MSRLHLFQETAPPVPVPSSGSFIMLDRSLLTTSAPNHPLDADRPAEELVSSAPLLTLSAPNVPASASPPPLMPSANAGSRSTSPLIPHHKPLSLFKRPTDAEPSGNLVVSHRAHSIIESTRRAASTSPPPLQHPPQQSEQQQQQQQQQSAQHWKLPRKGGSIHLGSGGSPSHAATNGGSNATRANGVESESSLLLPHLRGHTDQSLSDLDPLLGGAGSNSSDAAVPAISASPSVFTVAAATAAYHGQVTSSRSPSAPAITMTASGAASRANARVARKSLTVVEKRRPTYESEGRSRQMAFMTFVASSDEEEDEDSDDERESGGGGGGNSASAAAASSVMFAHSRKKKKKALTRPSLSDVSSSSASIVTGASEPPAAADDSTPTLQSVDPHRARSRSDFNRSLVSTSRRDADKTARSASGTVDKSKCPTESSGGAVQSSSTHAPSGGGGGGGGGSGGVLTSSASAPSSNPSGIMSVLRQHLVSAATSSPSLPSAAIAALISTPSGSSNAGTAGSGSGGGSAGTGGSSGAGSGSGGSSKRKSKRKHRKSKSPPSSNYSTLKPRREQSHACVMPQPLILPRQSGQLRNGNDDLGNQHRVGTVVDLNARRTTAATATAAADVDNGGAFQPVSLPVPLPVPVPVPLQPPSTVVTSDGRLRNHSNTSEFVIRESYQRALLSEAHDLITVLKRRDSTPAKVIEACKKLGEILHENPELERHLVANIAIIPVLDLVDTVPSSKQNPHVIDVALQLINQVTRKHAELRQHLCLIGAIPIVAKFTGKEYQTSIRLQATKFIQGCSECPITLHMFLACRGIPILVELFENDFTAHKSIIELALSSIYNIFLLSTSTPTNDFCNIFVRCGFLPRLVNAILNAENASCHEAMLKMVYVLEVFACGDSTIKRTICCDDSSNVLMSTSLSLSLPLSLSLSQSQSLIRTRRRRRYSHVYVQRRNSRGSHARP